MGKRKIAIVTGTRAEYGLLQTVMRAAELHASLQLQTVVTGMHLVTGTVRDISFAIDAKVPMQRKGATGRDADVQAVGRGISGLGNAFAKLKPEIVLVLGDRVEAFAAASAASIGGQHVAHIHGGDRAEGVADEAMRHAISKLAHIHLPATQDSAKRLIHMGERKADVHVVGSPAMDQLTDVKPADDDMLTKLKLDPDKPYVVILMHPTGQTEAQEYKQMQSLLKATAKVQCLVLQPNHDPGRESIVRAIKQAKCNTVDHLPRDVFLGVLQRAACLIGNSSAGIIEAAAVRKGGLPVVNIGSRQAGRLRPNNVIDCDVTQRAISDAIHRAMHNPPRVRKHPYGDGKAGERIAKLLANVNLSKIPIHKQNSY